MAKFNVGDVIIAGRDIEMPDIPDIPKGTNGIIKEIKITKHNIEYLIDFDCVINHIKYTDITLFEAEDKVLLKEV